MNNEKARIKNRINTKIDYDNYEFIPAKEQPDYYDTDINRVVAVYVRVSTDNVSQTTSFELQKKYYEEYVHRHSNWTLYSIFADSGISGTSLAKRDEFNKMINDCKDGKIDIIITKSVSRFARNVVDCISIVRMLSEFSHPVGVFFESECIFSLNEDSQMALSFQATMAQEESHTRSRSMETSLRMRLDGGLPLTPKLLGYTHDENGNLIINPEEAKTVKLIFYMYLYGFSTAKIAEILTEHKYKTHFGNTVWTANSVVCVLRSERHCGDIITRKTFTPNYLNHKSRKNHGDRPQSIYRNHHEAIIKRVDFIAVQQLLNNSKYGNKSILPELRVIESGLLKGFVRINPRWSGFKAQDYYKAVENLYSNSDSNFNINSENKISEFISKIEVEGGDFDMRDFEIAPLSFFSSDSRPIITFQENKIRLNAFCVKKFDKNNKIELLINPIEKKFAVRTAPKDSKYFVQCSNSVNGIFQSKEIASTAFFETIFQIFEWSKEIKYRISGEFFKDENELAYIFNIADAEIYIKRSILDRLENHDNSEIKPLSILGKSVKAIPKEQISSFGNQYYLNKNCSIKGENLEIQTKGKIFETENKLLVTEYEELKKFIFQEIGNISEEENLND